MAGIATHEMPHLMDEYTNPMSLLPPLVSQNVRLLVPRLRKSSKIGPKQNSLNFSILANKILLKSMAKFFTHPVGVFRTIPNPPKSPIMQKIDFWQYLVIFWFPGFLGRGLRISLFSAWNLWSKLHRLALHFLAVRSWAKKPFPRSTRSRIKGCW